MKLLPIVTLVLHNDDSQTLEVSQEMFKLKATFCLFLETKTFFLSLLPEYFAKSQAENTQTSKTKT